MEKYETKQADTVNDLIETDKSNEQPRCLSTDGCRRLAQLAFEDATEHAPQMFSTGELYFTDRLFEPCRNADSKLQCADRIEIARTSTAIQ